MDKITVRRANVVLDIDPEDKEYYMQNGYSVLDKAGRVVEKAMPVDANALKIQVAELTSELEKARKEIEALKSELDNNKQKEQRKPRNSKE